MQAINDFFAKYMGLIIGFFCRLCGNHFALAIFLFTLFINLVFCPLNIKQQKSTAAQARIKYKLEKLKEKYGDDKVKYQEEMSKVYQETGASPMSGCMLLLVRLPFFYGIYYAIQQPLLHILRLGSENILAAAKALGLDTAQRGYELGIMNNLDKLDGFADLKTAIQTFDFRLFGIDLTASPKFSWNFGEAFRDGAWLLWLIPLLSFATSMLSGVVSSKLQKINNPEAPGMTGLLLLMPLFSLWIAFNVPCAVGFYWACSNFVSMLMQIAMQLLYSPARVIARTEAKETLKRREAEQLKIRAVDGESSVSL